MDDPIGDVDSTGQAGAAKRNVSIWITVVISTVVLFAIWNDTWPWLRGPAPYPREWQWAFQPRATLDRLGSACAVAGILVGLLVASGSAWARRRPVHVRRLLLTGAVVVGTLFEAAVLHLEPQGAAATWMERTYSPRFTSYFSVAIATDRLSEQTILSDYDRILDDAGSDAFHAATHPPGGVLFYRALIRYFRGRPLVTSTFNRIGRWLGVDVGGLIPGDAPPPARSLPCAIAAIVGGLLLAFGGVLACVPLAYAAEVLGASPLAAVRIAILWCFCPALVNFPPSFDQLLALPIMCALTLLLAATIRSERGILAAAAAGAAMAGAALLSYGAVGMLPIACLAVLAAGWPHLQRTVKMLVIACVTAVIFLALLRLTGFNYLISAQHAFTRHRTVATPQRSYSLWLGFDLIDFTIFTGLPVVACTLMFVISGLARRGWWKDTGTRTMTAICAGLLLLDATGTVRGEVGRVWLPVMPMFYLGLLGHREQLRLAPTVLNASVVAGALAAFTIALRVRWGP